MSPSYHNLDEGFKGQDNLEKAGSVVVIASQTPWIKYLYLTQVKGIECGQRALASERGQPCTCEGALIPQLAEPTAFWLLIHIETNSPSGHRSWQMPVPHDEKLYLVMMHHGVPEGSGTITGIAQLTLRLIFTRSQCPC